MIDMAGSKKDKVQRGLAQRASGPLSKQLPTMTVGALERALLRSFRRPTPRRGTAPA